jgi:hypothetical protein
MSCICIIGMQSGFKVRVYNETDSERAIKLISDIIVNEFNFKLDPDNLDSDIICIEGHYKKSDGGCFWVAESIENYDNRNNHQINFNSFSINVFL